MKLTFSLLIIALVMAVATSACAGEMACKACNMSYTSSGHGCFQQKIVVAYTYWKMGPARKSDGRKNDTKLIDRWIGAYEDKNCKTLLDSAGYSVTGCAGTAYPPNLPPNGGVM